MKKKFCIINIISLLIMLTGCHILTVDARVIAPDQAVDQTEPEETEAIRPKGPGEPVEPTEAVEATEDGPEYAGVFSIAAYCGCKLCCGSKQEILTYNGTPPVSGQTIAADFTIFKPGEILMIDGHTYTVEDKSDIENSATLLLYFDSHKDALDFGRQIKEVYRIPHKEDSHGGELLGEFTVTGYCGCEECCGNYDKEILTFTETTPVSGYTIAADLDVIPLHSQLWIDGNLYVVEDTGGSIKGNRIDIYFGTHKEAVNYGKKQKKVYLMKD